MAVSFGVMEGFLGLLRKENIVQFDALSVYKKYTDVFDIDDVPEEERKEVAKQVAGTVLAALENGDVS